MKQFSQFELLGLGASAALAVMSLIGMPRSPDLIWAALFFVVSGVCLLLRPSLDRRRSVRQVRVGHDADGIRMYSGEVVLASITWDDLDEIALFTNATGPGGDDLVWLFANVTRSSIIMVPGACPGFPALLKVLQEMPGFDNVLLLEALGSVGLDRFVVWRRPHG
jgi:hypothetical protein